MLEPSLGDGQHVFSDRKQRLLCFGRLHLVAGERAMRDDVSNPIGEGAKVIGLAVPEFAEPCGLLSLCIVQRQPSERMELLPDLTGQRGGSRMPVTRCVRFRLKKREARELNRLGRL